MSSRKNVAPLCSMPGCQSRIYHPSGRCYHHRVASRVGSSILALTPPPSPDGSPTPHHTVEDLPNGGRIEQWFLGVRAHREDGPAEIAYAADGSVSHERWYRKGVLHRTDGPALIDYGPTGEMTREAYFVRDRLHRLDGPADLRSSDSGEVTMIAWCADGTYHSDLASLSREIGQWSTRKLRNRLAESSYAPLLAEGAQPHRIAEVLAQGVSSVEGIREVLGGAPVEWVRSFEEGRS